MEVQTRSGNSGWTIHLDEDLKNYKQKILDSKKSDRHTFSLRLGHDKSFGRPWSKKFGMQSSSLWNWGISITSLFSLKSLKQKPCLFIREIIFEMWRVASIAAGSICDIPRCEQNCNQRSLGLEMILMQMEMWKFLFLSVGDFFSPQKGSILGFIVSNMRESTNLQI